MVRIWTITTTVEVLWLRASILSKPTQVEMQLKLCWACSLGCDNKVHLGCAESCTWPCLRSRVAKGHPPYPYFHIKLWFIPSSVLIKIVLNQIIFNTKLFIFLVLFYISSLIIKKTMELKNQEEKKKGKKLDWVLNNFGLKK